MPVKNWGKRPSKNPAPGSLDNFVNPVKPTKRLNAEIPADLHTRVKMECVRQGREMTEVLIEILEQHFPPQLK